MKYSVTLGVLLIALWLTLSGHYTGLLIGLGVASVALVVWISVRMRVVDEESTPLKLMAVAPLYWLWLLKEIVLSNIDVIRRVLSPRLPISPRVIQVKSSQDSDVGRVTFANSITLTPGTVTLEARDGSMDVHALTLESAASLHTGDMDQRVSALERKR